ncbi:uncharacterized protein At1g66480-like [Punica granatum]|uniref:Uncharacterized protein At1g66480-like n=1 Tax=Punica granatum TaxID=22663 RepID=A0A6P8DRL1_PUNGR|nr:uncharacterized protein At1g66480-like [Punica granatum]
MGNAIGGKNRKVAKVMKITGETLKFKAPVEAGEVLRDYPGLVLLESESVKHYGTRAKPLGAHERLEPRRLYFLVELPKERAVPRRVRSGINMSAKDRLESLMLSRRSASDLSILAKPAGDDVPGPLDAGRDKGKEVVGSGVRVRLRLPKGELERVMRESRDEADAAEKIMNLYIQANKDGNKNNDDEVDGEGNVTDDLMEQQQQLHRKGSHGRREEGPKKREKRPKRVSFLAAREGGMQIAVAS